MQNPLARFQMFHPDIPMTVQFNKSGGTNLYYGTYDYDQYGGVPDKQAICIEPNLDSTGAVTLTFSGGLTAVPLLKANGTPVTNLKAGAYYNAKLNSARSAFILQGEGGSGNAVASDLLSGKSASTDAGDIVGTMPNRAGLTGATVTAIPGTGLNITPPVGYYNGSTAIIRASELDLIAGNIKSGVDLFGLVGTMPEGKKFALMGFPSSVLNSSNWLGNGNSDLRNFFIYMIIKGLSAINRTHSITPHSIYVVILIYKCLLY
jgi:hypothetical protein